MLLCITSTTRRKMTEPVERNYEQDIAYILSSFTDGGKSLRSFFNHPQELGVCILTAGLLSNSKLMLSPDDAINTSFELYTKIQAKIGQYQNMSFASNVEDCFRHPEVKGD